MADNAMTIHARFMQAYTRMDGNLKEMISGTSRSLFVRMAGAGISFALNVLLARMLGAEGVGQYFLAASLVMIASVIGRAGLDNAVLRLTAASASVSDWAAVKELHRKAMLLCTGASTLLCAAVFVLAPWLANFVFHDAGVADPLRWMAPAIVPIAVYTLYSQFLLAMKRVTAGVLVLNFWAPVFSLVAALALVPRWQVSGAAWAFSIGAALAMVIGTGCWWLAAPRVAGRGSFPARELLDSSMPLFWLSLAQLVIVLAPVLILGIWESSAQVGVFGAASRVVLLAGFIMTAVNGVAAPKFAALYKHGDMEALERLARQTTRLLIFAAGPVLVLFLAAPDWLMQMFGAQFTGGAGVVSIMTLGQLINVVTGPSGNLLMMCGHERWVRNNMIGCAALSIVLALLLIPSLGITGAAIAAATELAVENLIMAAMLWRRFGIMTLPLPAKLIAALLRQGRFPDQSREGVAAGKEGGSAMEIHDASGEKGRVAPPDGTEKLPAFFVVGAQKAGTTALHDWLMQQPDVSLPVIKETHYFSHDERFAQGLQWYRKQFRAVRACAVMGEVDPEYMFYGRAPERMRELVHAPRIVFILRHPLERAYSHYLMTVRRGHEELGFVEALRAEQQRLAGEGREFSLSHHSYLARGRYCEQITRYRSMLPDSGFLFVKFDDLTSPSAGLAAYVRICEFIGVHLSPPNDVKPRLAGMVDKLDQMPVSGGGLPAGIVIPGDLLDPIRAEIAQLEGLTGLNLGDWLVRTPGRV